MYTDLMNEWRRFGFNITVTDKSIYLRVIVYDPVMTTDDLIASLRNSQMKKGLKR